MKVILTIDTSGPLGQVSLSREGIVVDYMENEKQRDHAQFLAPAIQSLLQQAGLDPSAIEAVALSAGPGSYTGLRVASATAKGLCFALRIPMIAIGSLEVLAHAMVRKDPSFDLYCPMLDARRLEVYTACFDQQLNEVLPARALVLQPGSLADLLSRNRILFSGSGSSKWERLMNPKPDQAFFREIFPGPESLASLSWKAFLAEGWTDPAHFESLYLKAFHSPPV